MATEAGPTTFDARVHRIDRAEATNNIELLLRDEGSFIIGLISPEIATTATIDLATRLTRESLLRVSGSVQFPAVGGDTQKHDLPVVQIKQLTVLGEAVSNLPTSVVSHNAPGEEPSKADVLLLNERLNNRVLDVRVASTGAIIKLFSGVYELAVEHLTARGFIYITTPSLIDYQVPGDEDYFQVPYFGRTAHLTQTGELHLGQALSAGLERIFEIHHVFRRERDPSPRHLTEFVALELAFALKIDWLEILELAESLLIHIIGHLQKRTKYSDLLALVRRIYSGAGTLNLPIGKDGRLPRITFSEVKRILRDRFGFDTDDNSDLSPEEEKAISSHLASPDSAANAQPTDLVIITQYPKHLRPYNVQTSSEDPGLTNSFDIILRGQELASGFQAINDYKALRSAMATRNPPFNLEDPMWKPFLGAYEAGGPPQGGFGMGINRFLQSFLGLSSIHETVLFPRDLTRLAP
ncbi:Aspartyl-tRNA synthetase [Penicillium lividum]|nr:Aspartyl-tRNA synthetase [Penicillium lividum]